MLSEAQLQELMSQRQAMNLRMKAYQDAYRTDVEREQYWLSDSQVSRKLRIDVESQAGAAVYWPTGMIAETGLTALSSDDANYLNFMLKDSKVSSIVIPENNGGHWTFTILKRDPEAATWSSHRVATQADGSCGYSLVEQAKALVACKTDATWKAAVEARTKLPTYTAGAMRSALPTMMSGVKLADVVAVQPAVSVESPKAVQSSVRPVATEAVKRPLTVAQEEVKTAAEVKLDQEGFSVAQCELARNNSLQDVDGVDYLLSRMADAEMQGNGELLQHYQNELIATIKAMPSDMADDVRDRLSSLAHKDSIRTVIEESNSTSSAGLRSR